MSSAWLGAIPSPVSGGWSNRLWSWAVRELDEAHRQGESLLELAGPGRGLPGLSWKLNGLGLVLTCRHCPPEGSWVGQRQQRAVPPALGHGCSNTPEHLGLGQASSYLGSVQLIQHHHRGAVIIEHQPPEVRHGVG